MFRLPAWLLLVTSFFFGGCASPRQEAIPVVIPISSLADEVTTPLPPPACIVGPEDVEVSETEKYTTAFSVPLAEAGKEYSWQIEPAGVTSIYGSNDKETFVVLMNLTRGKAAEKQYFVSFVSYDAKQHDTHTITLKGPVSPSPDNKPPVVVVNTGVTANEGQWVGITSAELRTIDQDHLPSQLGYAVTKSPAHGQLELTKSPSTPVLVFTQHEIDSGLLVYRHNGSKTASDSFSFSVSDGHASANGIVALTITPPTPPEPPAPILEPGFRVLIVYEAADMPTYPIETQMILTGVDIRDFLKANCVPEGTHPGFRIYDKDVNLGGELEVWKQAMTRERSAVPWVLISNGTTGFEGPLPKTPSEFLELCKKYLPTK